MKKKKKCDERQAKSQASVSSLTTQGVQVENHHPKSLSTSPKSGVNQKINRCMCFELCTLMRSDTKAQLRVATYQINAISYFSSSTQANTSDLSKTAYSVFFDVAL